MFIKLIAVLIILIGIAGLILPIIPGILMITLGILLLYRERHEEMSRVINEKAPTPFANFYNDFLHKIILPPHYVGIDWDFVKKEVHRSEHIDISDKSERAVNIRAALSVCIRKARSLADAKYFFIEKKILQIGDDFIEIEGPVRFSTRKIPPFIKGAESLALFVVTIGNGIEKEASLFTSGSDPLGGYLLDRIGSFAVESLAERLENRLRRNYSLLKKSVSSRFSPGYCDWPTEEQFKLAKVLDFSKAGVELTEGCMMVPKKSISAMVAIANEGIFKKFISSCDICEKGDCEFRRNH
ncbi:MAG: vitamin B12 dependent-methionine synthase activation domain-containing protein [Candidatus Omnitrophota bacterium]|nr:vitamin B12 dependent-methionine synthase activation domain-containing protein [Candidatus Omnitrophota bacterium]